MESMGACPTVVKAKPPAISFTSIPSTVMLPWSVRAPVTAPSRFAPPPEMATTPGCKPRSEEHTSELQSQSNLVCRLLLEKKKKQKVTTQATNEHRKKDQ